MKNGRNIAVPTILLTALTACALLLSGCSGAAPAPTPTPTPEPTPTPDPMKALLEEEDAAIRAAMAEEGFGWGDKLAVWVEEDDQYSFHGAWLPDELRAETPEEIGAFLHLRGNEGDVFSVVLYGAVPNLGFGNEGVLGGEGSISADSRFYCPLREVNGDTMVGDMTLSAFLEEYFPQLLEAQVQKDRSNKAWARENEIREYNDQRRENQKTLLETLNDPSRTVEFGGGTLFVGYDEETGEYTQERIPESLQASTMEEVGYILSYAGTWEIETKSYLLSGATSKIRTFDVPLERLMVRILDAATGKEIAFFRKDAYAPLSVLTEAELGKQYASIDETALRNAFLESGLEWPFEE